jgi:hypothetical protein
MTSDSGDDAGREPLAPSDVALLLESGVPPEAITDSGLDLDLLRSLGWSVDEGFIQAPDDEKHREIAQRAAERAMSDSRTRRGYR